MTDGGYERDVAAGQAAVDATNRALFAEAGVPDHDPLRPSWDCACCGRPWPCDPAREHLAGELGGTALVLNMVERYVVDVVHDRPWMPASELDERFIAWTRNGR